jgi:ParB/Sulfiredoxin domain
MLYRSRLVDLGSKAKLPHHASQVGHRKHHCAFSVASIGRFVQTGEHSMKATKRPESSASCDNNGKAKVSKIRLDTIRLDAGTQTRAHIDEVTVAEYSEAMARGDQFPPVIVFQNDGACIMADGFHRFRSARRAKLTHILAEIRQGSRRDALRFALGANHKHGLRRSNLDKRRAVEMALTEFGNLSDHFISDMCGVCQSLVTNLRHQLISEISSPRRLGKDGKLRTLPVRRVDGSSRPEAGMSAARLQWEAGNDGGSNGEVGNPAFIEVADALAGLEERVEALVHDHPQKTAAVLALIAKVRSDLLQLENRLRSREGQ